MVLISLAALILLFWLQAAWAAGVRGSRIPFLRDLPVDPDAKPSVSVIVAARNEGDKLEECLHRLLGLQAVELELIPVDDRSDDATGEIIDALATHDGRVRPVHIRNLPSGWLGKNNALHHGAAMASSEWLLFTDGDVMLEPLSVARAIQFAEKEGLDHLTATPQLRMPGILTNLFAGTFALFFAGYSKAWDARNPRSKAHVGIGAFNLLRRSTYRAIGGHEPLRLRPDDDMMLGKLVKKSGFTQDLVHGRGQLAVEWYSSLRQAVLGLEKNAFAGMGYSFPRAVVACTFILLVIVGPYLLIPFTSGVAFWLSVVAVLLVTVLYAGSTTVSGTPMWLCLVVPLGGVLMCYILLRASILTVARGGIRWRGTSYSLADLRSNRL